MAPSKTEIEEKFRKVSDDRKKATSTLPTWGDIYRLGDFSNITKHLRLTKVSPIFGQTGSFIAVYLDVLR